MVLRDWAQPHYANGKLDNPQAQEVCGEPISVIDVVLFFSHAKVVLAYNFSVRLLPPGSVVSDRTRSVHIMFLTSSRPSMEILGGYILIKGVSLGVADMDRHRCIFNSVVNTRAVNICYKPFSKYPERHDYDSKTAKNMYKLHSKPQSYLRAAWRDDQISLGRRICLSLETSVMLVLHRLPMNDLQKHRII